MLTISKPKSAEMRIISKAQFAEIRAVSLSAPSAADGAFVVFGGKHASKKPAATNGNTNLFAYLCMHNNNV